MGACSCIMCEQPFKLWTCIEVNTLATCLDNHGPLKLNTTSDHQFYLLILFVSPQHFEAHYISVCVWGGGGGGEGGAGRNCTV